MRAFPDGTDVDVKQLTNCRTVTTVGFQRIARAVTPIVGGAAFAALYLSFIKMMGGGMLQCPIHYFTGLQCPGCGSQRAFHALLQGDIAGALQTNLLLLPSVLYLAVLWTGYVWPDKPATARLYRMATTPTALLAMAAIFVGWFIVRNILDI